MRTQTKTKKEYIYQKIELQDEDANEWLENMSKYHSFKPISISVTSGCGIWYYILYKIDKRIWKKVE